MISQPMKLSMENLFQCYIDVSRVLLECTCYFCTFTNGYAIILIKKTIEYFVLECL